MLRTQFTKLPQSIWIKDFSTHGFHCLLACYQTVQKKIKKNLEDNEETMFNNLLAVDLFCSSMVNSERSTHVYLKKKKWKANLDEKYIKNIKKCLLYCVLRCDWKGVPDSLWYSSTDLMLFILFYFFNDQILSFIQLISKISLCIFPLAFHKVLLNHFWLQMQNHYAKNINFSL